MAPKKHCCQTENSHETGQTIVVLVGVPVGLLICGGAIYPGGPRKLLAHLVGQALPWLIGLAVLVAAVVVVSVMVALVRRRAGRRSVLWSWWRSVWHYRRRWADMMALHGLVVIHDDKTLIPRLVRVVVGEHTDTVFVRMIAGQAPVDWQHRSEALAHAFGAGTARVRVVKPQLLALDLRYRDTLAEPIPLSDRRSRKLQAWRDAA